ncbi:MAG: hypothetical protein K2K36_05520, partial [Muribaculaceae bacterium]|nr:hypothetical protein [Muribaculaceae bacterium]
PDARALRLLLGDLAGQTIACTQLDAEGNSLESRALTGSFAEIALRPGTHAVRLDGHAELFEVIPVKGSR